jgi:hypothetical protein
MDIRSFIQTSSASSAAANATLRLQTEGAGNERLQAGAVTFIGKVAAVLRSVFHVTSPAERQATQAFVAAVRQDYGSSGAEALKRLNITADKPLQVRQVRELAQTLQANQASDELKPFRTLGESHIVDQANDIWRWDRFTDLRRVVSHSLADLSQEAEAIVEAAVNRGVSNANGRPELAFMTAVAAGDADRLWNLPGVRQEFERRLDITGVLPDSPIPVRDHIVRRANDPDDGSVAAATVLADMFRDRRDALQAAGIRAAGY